MQLNTTVITTSLLSLLLVCEHTAQAQQKLSLAQVTADEANNNVALISNTNHCLRLLDEQATFKSTLVETELLTPAVSSQLSKTSAQALTLICTEF